MNLIDDMTQALDWYKNVDWQRNPFPQQMSSLPNDGTRVLAPIEAGEKGFHIRLHKASNENPLLHRHGGFVLLYMYRGACHTCINDQSLLLRPGDILLISPNVLHRNQLAEPDALMFHCHIECSILSGMILPLVREDVTLSSFILDFIRDAGSQSTLYFPAYGADPAIAGAFEKIIIEYAARQPMYQSLLCSEFAQLLMLLARKKYNLSAASYGTHARVSEVLDYISAHYADATLAETARIFHYHPNYLSSLIRRQTGHSFSQLLQTYRLSRACFLLQNTPLSTEQIALQVGYKDVSSFYKAYKKNFGVTPRGEQQETNPSA